jgi:hypothetical protein
MSKGEKKREFLYDKFSNNLLFLKDNGIVSKDKDDYICPICFRKFTKEDLNQEKANPLSLEDAPPKSLGGSQIALTCEKCNNGMGKDIDWHLTERLNEMDFHDRIPGAEMKGKFTLNGITVNGKIMVVENGLTKAHLSKKNNNPETLEEYIKLINEKGEKRPYWEPNPTRVDSKKLQIALIKNAYILLFEKFGYAFLFDKEYDRIREQLLNPESDVYPLKCWFEGPFPEERIGVPFITEKNLESIFALFKLSTRLKTRIFGVVLPLSGSKIEKIILELDNRFEHKKQFSVNMEIYNDDYLTNLESVNMLLKYMENLKTKTAHNTCY